MIHKQYTLYRIDPQKGTVCLKNCIFHTIFCMGIIVLFTQSAGADWVQTNGPYGGKINAIEVMGSKTLVATFGGGIYSSTSNGNRWAESNSGLSVMYLKALVTCGGTVLAGTDGNGIFKSTDSGTTWKGVTTGLILPYVLAFATSGATIFAGTYDGIFRSIDFGENWSSVDTAFKDRTILSMAVDGNTIFAGTNDSGIIRSTDNGVSWTFIKPEGSAVGSIDAIAKNGNTVFAGRNYSTSSRIYRSLDNGTTWSTVYLGKNNTFVWSFAFCGNAILAATTIGVLRSTDNGTTWVKTIFGLSDTLVQTLKVSGSNIFAGTEHGGVFLSTNNGDNWAAVNTGLTNTSASVWATSGNTLLAMAYENGVLRSVDNGTNWTPITTPPGNPHFSSFMESADTIFAGSDKGAYLSTDTGTNWLPINSGIEKASVSSWVKHGSDIFIGTSLGVFCTSNRGRSWTLVGLGSIYDVRITSLAVCGNTILAATYKKGIFRLTKTDTTWSVVNSGLKDKDVVSLAISGKFVLAGSFYGIFRSRDNGLTWTDTIIPPSSVNSLLVLDTVILAAGTGVFCSKDTGATWTKINTGLPTATANSTISSLAVCSNNIFAGVSAKGVWRRPLQEILSTQIVQLQQKMQISLPCAVDVYTSFSSQVGIKFSLTHSESVWGGAYDLAGRMVEPIVNQTLGAGIHHYVWDASDVVKGCYLVRIRVGETVTARIVRTMD